MGLRVTLGLLALLGALAQPLAGAAQAAPIRVVTVSTVLTEIAREVGGPEVRITALLPPGVDPHTFEPAPADVQALADADLVLASGLGLNNSLDKLVADSGTRAPVLDAGDALAGQVIFTEVRGHREPDPHWWNSPRATETVTRAVASMFEALRPAGRAGFEQRARAYETMLRGLDAWARRELAGLPAGRRQLVTTHDAFAWFARDYGFTVHPISGLSPEADPDARELAHLIDLIRRERIPAVFVENSANSKLAAALARETGVRLGGVLYGDGLVTQPDGATYPAMFRHNVRTIVEALR